MLQPILNAFKLMRILRERGNWPLIRHSRRQLRDFVLCRNGLNPKPWFQIPFYWFYLLKGLDMLVWRLETFGFLYQPETREEDKARLNQYLQKTHNLHDS